MPPAHRSSEDLGGVVIGRVRPPALEAHHDMRLLEPSSNLGLAAAISGALLGRRRRGVELFEARLSEGKDMIVLDRAGRGDDRGAGAIAAAQIVVDGRPVEGLDALARAENRPADRLVRPGGRGEEIEHQVVRRVFDRADLLEDDVLLPFELIRVECALGEKIAHDVERELDVAAHQAGEIARSLDSGLRIEIAADVLDRLGDFAGASTARALERHVLDEMRESVLACALVARSRGDEDADRRGPHMRRRLGDDGEPGRKAGDLNAHAAARKVWRR